MISVKTFGISDDLRPVSSCAAWQCFVIDFFA